MQTQIGTPTPAAVNTAPTDPRPIKMTKTGFVFIDGAKEPTPSIKCFGKIGKPTDDKPTEAQMRRQIQMNVSDSLRKDIVGFMPTKDQGTDKWTTKIYVAST